MSINRFYTAVLPVPTVINSAANYFLIPTQYFLGTRIIEVVNRDTIRQYPLTFEQGDWKKTVLMICLLIPSLIAGTLLRLVSFAYEDVRICYAATEVKPKITKRDPYLTPPPSPKERSLSSGKTARRLTFSPTPQKAPVRTEPEIDFTYEQLDKIESFYRELLAQNPLTLATWINGQNLDFYPFYHSRHIERHQDEFEDGDRIAAHIDLYKKCESALLDHGSLKSILNDKPESL
jgi:hypothetical protein